MGAKFSIATHFSLQFSVNFFQWLWSHKCDSETQFSSTNLLIESQRPWEHWIIFNYNSSLPQLFSITSSFSYCVAFFLSKKKWILSGENDFSFFFIFNLNQLIGMKLIISLTIFWVLVVMGKWPELSDDKVHLAMGLVDYFV